MKYLQTFVVNTLFIILSAGLVACSGSGGGGAVATTDTSTEIWSGPARLQECDNDVGMADMLPDIQFIDGRAFVAAKATFERTRNLDSAGVLTSETLALVAIYYDGAVFFDLTDSDPGNDAFAPTAVTAVDPPPPPDNLLHLEFDNVPTVTVGPPETSLTYTNVPVIEGGGLVMSDDGINRPHAFLYIHDMFGCDLVIAAIQKAMQGETGDEPLPVYSEADLMSTSWSGISEEFRDDSVDNAPDSFPLILTWIDEPAWTLDIGMSASLDITGSGSNAGSPVNVTSGYLFLEDSHGYFTGMLSSSAGDWAVRGLMTPDKAYIGGFTWLAEQAGMRFYWHDLSLEKQ